MILMIQGSFGSLHLLSSFVPTSSPGHALEEPKLSPLVRCFTRPCARHRIVISLSIYCSCADPDDEELNSAAPHPRPLSREGRGESETKPHAKTPRRKGIHRFCADCRF